MENSQAQKQVINLGKLFVKELGLEPGVDTFSRWMAHYLAEKMTIAENSKGEGKASAEKECFEVILKLWKHRRDLQSGRRPLEEFEPIIEILNKIISIDSPERPIFYREDKKVGIPDFEEVNFDKMKDQDWLTIVKQIDRVARIWIEYSLRQYATKVKKENAEEWLKNAIHLKGNGDVKIMNIIFGNRNEQDEEEIQKTYKLEKLKQKIKELERFKVINELILKAHKVELEKAIK